MSEAVMGGMDAPYKCLAAQQDDPLTEGMWT